MKLLSNYLVLSSNNAVDLSPLSNGSKSKETGIHY